MRFSWNMQAPRLLAVLRIGVGLLFMQHGAQKLFGVLNGSGLAATKEAVPLASLMGVAGILELVGGFLVVIGLLTRPVAFLLAGQMLVAYFMVHAPQGLFPIENKGEPALLYLLPFLYLSAAGPGVLAVDNVIRWGSASALTRGPEQPRSTADVEERVHFR